MMKIKSLLALFLIYRFSERKTEVAVVGVPTEINVCRKEIEYETRRIDRTRT